MVRRAKKDLEISKSFFATYGMEKQVIGSDKNRKFASIYANRLSEDFMRSAFSFFQKIF